MLLRLPSRIASDGHACCAPPAFIAMIPPPLRGWQDGSDEVFVVPDGADLDALRAAWTSIEPDAQECARLLESIEASAKELEARGLPVKPAPAEGASLADLYAHAESMWAP